MDKHIYRLEPKQQIDTVISSGMVLRVFCWGLVSREGDILPPPKEKQLGGRKKFPKL